MSTLLACDLKCTRVREWFAYSHSRSSELHRAKGDPTVRESGLPYCIDGVIQVTFRLKKGMCYGSFGDSRQHD